MSFFVLEFFWRGRKKSLSYRLKNLLQLEILKIALVFLQGVFFYYLATYKPVKYGSYEYPMWAEALGLCISASSMIWVPAYAIYYVLSRPGSIMEVRTVILIQSQTI